MLLNLRKKMLLIRLSLDTDIQIFRPGKTYTGQFLNLTQYFEDGYKKRLATGIVLVDLFSAYGTVNHNLLLRELYSTTRDFRVVHIIFTLLSNRRFTVSL